MKVYLLVSKDERGYYALTGSCSRADLGVPDTDERIITVTIPDDALDRAFAEVEVEGEVE